MSAGCRYEVELYIYFLNIMSTVLLLHSVQISSSKCFSNYKTRRIHVTDGADWKHAECDVSNAILYQLSFVFFFLEYLIMIQ